MDWYCYFKERFTWGGNPHASVEKCRQIADELLTNSVIPSRIGLEAAVGFLAAARDFAGDGCFVSTDFASIADSVIGEVHEMAEAVFALDNSWSQDDGQAGPAYDPGEYEVWPEEDEWAEEPPDDEGDEEEPKSMLEIARPILDQLYGDGGESGTTGTRRPWPDWDHISDWTATDWLKLQTFKDKILAAAETGFMGVSSVAGVLAAAKGAMTHVPLPRQVEIAMWATEVVDCLMFALEDDLQTMCAGSLHSHQGRLVQKQLVSAANGQAQDSPDLVGNLSRKEAIL